MKRIIIIGILIALIMSFVTALLIVNTKYLELQNEAPQTQIDDIPKTEVKKEVPVLYTEYHTPINDGVKGAQFGDVYSTNALKWEKVFYEDNKMIGYYYKISGLKNKSIQTSVNEKLKKEFLEYGKDLYYQITNSSGDREFGEPIIYVDGLTTYYYGYEDISEYGNNWKVYINQYVISSFSNVISVATGSFTNNSGSSIFYYRKHDTYINIDLNTGEDIEFASLFSYGTDIIGTIRNGLYLQLADYDSYTEDIAFVDKWTDDDGEEYSYTYYTNQHYEEIKLDELEKLIKKFKYTKDVDFYFSPTQFGIKIEDYCFYHNFINMVGNIAIYNRYLSEESLYEDDNLAFSNLKAYVKYPTDNRLKMNVNELKIGNVIISYTVNTLLDEEDADIINNGLLKIDELVREDAKNLNTFADDDNYVYFSANFIIDKASTFEKTYQNKDNPYTLDIVNQINFDKKMYFIAIKDYDYYKISKEKYDNGFSLQLLEKQIEYEDDYRKYQEYDKLRDGIDDITSEYAKYMGFEYIYEYHRNKYEKPVYSIPEAQYLDTPSEIVKFILKDNSEEGIKRFINSVCSFVKYEINHGYNKDRIISDPDPNYYYYNDYNSIVFPYSYDDSYLGVYEFKWYFSIIDRTYYGNEIYPVEEFNYT